jgi:oligoendopeptidase F
LEQTWNAESVFATPAEWDKELEAVNAAIEGLTRHAGKLSEGPGALRAYLEEMLAVDNRLDRLGVYAHMCHAVDTGDQEAMARLGKVIGTWSRMAAAISFAEPEMLAIGADTLLQWADQDEGLSIYRHFLGDLKRRAPHVRSPEVEEILGQLVDVFSAPRQAHDVLSDAELRFEPAVDSKGNSYEIGQGSIRSLLSSPDRALRRSAWERYADAYLAHRSTMAQCLAGGFKQNVFTARARRYDSALEWALSPANIPTSVFHNLLATFQEHLPLWHRYWEALRRALKVEKLAAYDVHAAPTLSPPTVTWEQAVEWTCKGMEPLGEEYVAVMRRGLKEQRWVDFAPNRGKRMGAFSTGAQGIYPFILMSFNNDVQGVSTLAHELGHSMHSYLTWQNQPPIYAGYSLFAAEVASNFNQALVRHYLMSAVTDRDFQLALIEETMANFHRYFFIMPTLARFELEMHERVERGEALTADLLCGRMAELFREAFGPEVEFDAERIGITWAQFPTHLYSRFYVYQYATGIAGAHALAEGVLEGRPGAVERYLTFLRSGGSGYAMDLLREAGVDLSSPEPVRAAFAVMRGVVERLESLAG